jgi:hypothetical protein
MNRPTRKVAQASRLPCPASRRKPVNQLICPRGFGRDVRTRTRDACAPPFVHRKMNLHIAGSPCDFAARLRLQKRISQYCGVISQYLEMASQSCGMISQYWEMVSKHWAAIFQYWETAPQHWEIVFQHHSSLHNIGKLLRNIGK